MSDRRLYSYSLLLCLASSACVATIAPESSDNDAGVLANQQAITAQPDPSCTYASFNGRDYWVCNGARTFSAAQTVCASVGMNLVRIDNLAEGDFVRGAIPSDVWMGASDSAAEGVWRWQDGTQFWQGAANGSVVGGLYARWASGEPNDQFLSEDCGAVYKSNGQWNDAPCGDSKAFVCEATSATASQPKAPDTACTRAVRNGVEYWSCSNPRTWDDARAHCQARGLDLATIGDATEATWLNAQIPSDSYIGLTDRQQEGAWRWASDSKLSYCGETSRPVYGAYSNWSAGQPARDNTCTNADDGAETYWFCKDALSWSAAGTECAGSGMSLARIDNLNEDNFVTANLSVDSYVDGNDNTVEGTFVYGNGVQVWSGGKASGGRFTNWDTGEPNNLLGENCLMMYRSNGHWNDTTCTNNLLSPGFVCEGPKGSGHPDRNDCAYAQASSSSRQWVAGKCDVPRAYVCETVVPGAASTLSELASEIDSDHRTAGPRIDSVEYKSTSNVTEPFMGHEQEFGLRTCVDSIEPIGTPRTIASLGLEEVLYGQFYKGVQVASRGYSVLRDPTTKLVRSVLGNLATGIETQVTPVMTEAAALARALSTVGRTASQYAATPRGRFVLVQKQQGQAAQWELSWYFDLPPAAGDYGHHVGVSAMTDTVLLNADGIVRQACATTPITTTGSAGQVTPIPLIDTLADTFAYQQSTYNDDPQILTSRDARTANTPIALYSNGASWDTTSPVRYKPLMKMVCGADPTVMTPIAFPTTTINVSTTPADAPGPEAFGAGAFNAMQHCLDYVARNFEWLPLNPWIGVDGQGKKPINMMVIGGGPAGAFYSQALDAFAFDYTNAVHDSGAIEVACHELAHAIWTRSLPSGFVFDPETASLNEGFGDILGSSAEMWMRGYPPQSGFCMIGDAFSNKKCVHDLANPDASSGVILPREYLGPNYCTASVQCGPTTTSNVACCDEHDNSTVFGHWFALLAQGGAGLTSQQCVFSVTPLDPNLGKSVRLASRIAFNAVRDSSAAATFGYPAMAEATLKSAKAIFGADTTLTATARAQMMNSVAEAWAAANVRYNDDPALQKLAVPAVGSTNVYPWVQFEWPAKSNETSWDIQLGRGDLNHVVFDQRNVTTYEDRNGQRIGKFQFALREKTTDHYVWRARAHENNPWSDCHAVNWFEGTGTLQTPNLTVSPNDAQGKLIPGQIEMDWAPPPTPAFTEHQAQFSTTNTGCQVDNTNAPIAHVSPVEYGFEETGTYYLLTNANPSSHYFANVWAIGPVNAESGAATQGPCATVVADTGPLAAPELARPALGARFDLYPPFERDPSYVSGPANLDFEWFLETGATSSILRLYRRTATGCSTAVEHTELLAAPGCAGTNTCAQVLNIKDFKSPLTPYPGGYCWDVIGVASNNVQSPPSAKGNFGFFVDVSASRGPGISATQGVTGALLGKTPKLRDTYGSKVTLHWAPVANAVGYSVKVWNWKDGLGQTQGTTGKNPTTFPGSTTAAQAYIDVPGAQGGQGRYCWELTPQIEDPSTPGVAVPPALQPRFWGGGPLCYVTGPKAPSVVFDQAPDSSGKFTATLTGHVDYEFIPDQQYEWPSTAKWIQWQTGTWCPAGTNTYGDIVKCSRKFTIPYVANATGTLEIKTYNEPTWPFVPDPEYLVQDVKKTYSFASCGSETQACCPTGNKCDPGAFLDCVSGKCIACGRDVDQACCSTGTVCANGNVCVSGVCAAPGDACNSTLQAGGNDPETHTIELGKKSGITRFSFNTYDVGDVITVKYENKQIDFTNCLQTAHAVDGCALNGVQVFNDKTCNASANPLPANCVCCQSGQCWDDIRFSGSSSEMIVTVNPNCTISDGDTQWNFQLSCAQ